MLCAAIKCINFLVFSRVKILVVQITNIKVMITETKTKKKPADPATEISLIVSFSLTVLVSNRLRSPPMKIIAHSQSTRSI